MGHLSRHAKDCTGMSVSFMTVFKLPDSHNTISSIVCNQKVSKLYCGENLYRFQIFVSVIKIQSWLSIRRDSVLLWIIKSTGQGPSECHWSYSLVVSRRPSEGCGGLPNSLNAFKGLWKPQSHNFSADFQLKTGNCNFLPSKGLWKSSEGQGGFSSPKKAHQMWPELWPPPELHGFRTSS